MSDLSFGKERRRHYFDIDILIKILKWTFEIAIVCLIAFVLVWYFGQRVRTIGDSMKPVLENGDVTLLNRIIYNASRPDRGDVIAFYPNGNKKSYCYIKRIVGLPGETVELKDGSVYINGKKIKEKYKTTKIEDVGLINEAVKLGSDEYFVLGDDRTGVEDSRSAEVGYVKRSEIEGKVWFVAAPRKHVGFVK